MASHHEILLSFSGFWVFSSDYALHYTVFYPNSSIVQKVAFT